MKEKNISKKEIHIVFQVLNFLRSNHHSALITSHFEHLLLIHLVSHKGPKGINPSVPTLAKELHCSDRYIRNGLKKWEALEVIQIISNSGKRNSYYVFIPGSTPEPEFTPVPSDTPEPEFTPPLNSCSATPEPEFRIYNKGSTKEVTNSFYMQKAENEKKHDFAQSMDQMACEKRHIEKHEEFKRAPMPDHIRKEIDTALSRNLK